jgi:hypothetical protein
MARTAWEERAALEETAAAETGRARDAALRHEAGKAKRQDAHDRLVRAHQEGKDGREIERAKKAIREADQDLEFMAAEAEGLANRAAVAKQAVASFDVTDNGRLLDELRPKAEEVTERLASLFASIPEVADEYNAIVAAASRLVSVAGKSPVEEGPDGHGLDQLLHIIKHPPLPAHAKTV